MRAPLSARLELPELPVASTRKISIPGELLVNLLFSSVLDSFVIRSQGTCFFTADRGGILAQTANTT